MDPRRISTALYLAVAVMAVLLAYVAIRAALA
jgi:nucleoside permease NupC